MEAKKSQDLLSVSWRIRKTGGVIKFESKEWEADGVSLSPKCENQEHRCIRAEEDGCPSLSKKGKFALPPPFCSGPQWIE